MTQNAIFMEHQGTSRRKMPFSWNIREHHDTKCYFHGTSRNITTKNAISMEHQGVSVFFLLEYEGSVVEWRT